MTPGEIAQIMGGAAALLASGGWAARLGIRAAEQRKLLAEARIAEETAGGMVTKSAFGEWKEIVIALRQEVDRLRASRDEALDRLRIAEKRGDDLETDLRQALRDIDDLKHAGEGRRPLQGL